MSNSEAITKQYSARAKALKGAGGWGRNEAISFIYGFPAPECLPNARLESITQTVLQKHGMFPLQYGGWPGDDGLRDQLVAKLARDQKINVSRDQIMLTAGSSQAISFICDLLLDADDTVLSEAPTFLGTVRTMSKLGVDVRGVPLDADGTRVDALETLLKDLRALGKRPKLFYIIPNFQNPTGVTTTLARRKRIVELAREYDFVIMEDDAYYDLRFSGEPLPPLFSLEGGARSIYLGTLSKTLAPGLRLGYAVAPQDVLDRIDLMHDEGGASPFSMHVGWEFCKDGGLDANIQRLKAIYKRRCDTMQDALSELMPAGVTWTQPQGGFFIWVTLPTNVDSMELIKLTRARGVDFLPGPACFFDGSGKNTLRLAFSFAPQDKFAEGIRVIADCVKQMMKG